MRKLMFLLFIISTQTAFAGEVTKLFCKKTTESSCRIEQSIFAFITTEKSFNSLNHKFELYVDGLYESNMTLKEFLSSNYLKQTIELKKTNVNYQTKSNLLTLNSMNPGIISTQDHPLRCDRDVDWGCENWRENKYTNELMSRLENMPPISLQVTQEFVDGNIAALQAMMSALTYHPASKLAFYAAKLGQHVVYVKLSESAAGTAISIFFGAAVAGLLDLKAGDILTFDGKSNVTKTSASGSSSGGSGSSSGGCSGGGTITIPGGNGGTVIFACTGTRERLVCKPIIV